jgi:hypothetical protein
MKLLWCRYAPLHLSVLVLAACAPSLTQFFDDEFFAQDRVYQNTSLGFTLRYPAGWRIAASPDEMDETQQTAARILHRQGAELLFAGGTVEGTQGTRAIVENLNCTNEEYLAKAREANRGNIQKDLGDASIMAGEQLMVRWEYLFHDMHFAEFLFRAGSYNVRVAFWCKPDVFPKFLQVYEDVMGTLERKASF